MVTEIQPLVMEVKSIDYGFCWHSREHFAVVAIASNWGITAGPFAGSTVATFSASTERKLNNILKRQGIL